MPLEEFKHIVEKMRNEHPIWFGLDSDSLIDNKQIDKIECYFQIELPVEYKDFLKTYGGGDFCFLTIFSGDKDSDWHIINQNKELDLFDRLKFLAVSNNGTGDYYGFKVNGGKCETKMSFYDHEEDRVIKTEYEDFFQFVIKLGLNM